MSFLQVPPLQGVELEAYISWISRSEAVDRSSLESLTGELINTLYPYAEYSVFTIMGTLMKEYFPTLTKKEAAEIVSLCRSAAELLEKTLVGKGNNDWLSSSDYIGMWHTYGKQSQFSGLIPGGSVRDETIVQYFIRVITIGYPVMADASQKITDKNRARIRQAAGSMVRICVDVGKTDWKYAPLMVLVGEELREWIDEPVHAP